MTGAYGGSAYGGGIAAAPDVGDDLTLTVDGLVPPLTGSVDIDAGAPPLTLTVNGVVPPLTGDVTLDFVFPAIPWDADTMLGNDDLHPNDLGMTTLAGHYIDRLDATSNAPDPGATLVAFGDSYTAADEENTPGHRAIQLLAAHYDFMLDNRAVSGYRFGDVAAVALITNVYVPGSSAYVFVQVGVNDLTNTDTAQVRTAFEHYLRAFFTLVSANDRIEDTAFTYSAGWTTHTGQVASGGSNHGTSTDGATATYTIASPGDYVLMSHGTTPTGGLTGGQLTVTQGAEVLAVVDLDDQAIGTGKLLGSYGPLPIPLPDLAAGTLTVTFHTLGRSSAQGWIDCLVRLDPDPPVIIASKPVYVTESSRQKPDLLDYIRGLYDQMAADFTNVVLVDASGVYALSMTVDGQVPPLSGSIALALGDAPTPLRPVVIREATYDGRGRLVSDRRQAARPGATIVFLGRESRWRNPTAPPRDPNQCSPDADDRVTLEWVAQLPEQAFG